MKATACFAIREATPEAVAVALSGLTAAAALLVMLVAQSCNACIPQEPLRSPHRKLAMEISDIQGTHMTALQS